MISSLLIKVASIVIAAAIIFLVTTAIRRWSGGRLSLWLPAILYLGAGAALLILRYFALASTVFLIGIFLHLILLRVSQFLRDRSKFRRLNPKSLGEITQFLQDKNVVFFKSKAGHLANARIDDYTVFLESIFRSTGSSVFRLMSMMTLAYRNSGFTSVPLVLDVKFNFSQVNASIEIVNNPVVWTARVHELRNSYNSLQESRSDQDVAQHLAEIEENILRAEACQKVAGLITVISDEDLIKSAMQESCVESLEKFFAHFVPKTFYRQHPRDKNYRFEMGVIIDVEAIPTEPLIWYHKNIGISASADTGRAGVAPNISKLIFNTTYAFGNGGISKLYPLEFAQDDRFIDFQTPDVFKSSVMRNVYKFFSRGMLGIFGLKSSVDQHGEHAIRSDGPGLVDKIAEELTSEAKSKIATEVEALLVSGLSGAVVFSAETDVNNPSNHLLTAAFNKHSAEFLAYIDQANTDLSNIAETVLASIPLGFDMSIEL